MSETELACPSGEGDNMPFVRVDKLSRGLAGLAGLNKVNRLGAKCFSVQMFLGSGVEHGHGLTALG